MEGGRFEVVIRECVNLRKEDAVPECSNTEDKEAYKKRTIQKK
jgi:hypothetical protein